MITLYTFYFALKLKINPAPPVLFLEIFKKKVPEGLEIS